MKIVIIFMLILMTFVWGCNGENPGDNGENPVDLASLVPKDNDISGWLRDGSLKEFNSIDELYDEIDGEAQVYDNYGFKASAVQEFKGPDELTLRLVINDQTDNIGASGLYEELGDGTEQIIPGLGASGRGSEYIGVYYVEFYRTRYYVTVELRDPQMLESSKQTAQEFAKIVDSKILLI